MSTQTTLLEIVHKAIEEVSRPLARLPSDFGLLVARYLQAEPFNYSTSVSTMGEGQFRLFVDEFKGMDWYVDMHMSSTFSYTTNGPHECARAVAEEDSVVGPVVEGNTVLTRSDVIKEAVTEVVSGIKEAYQSAERLSESVAILVWSKLLDYWHEVKTTHQVLKDGRHETYVFLKDIDYRVTWSLSNEMVVVGEPEELARETVEEPVPEKNAIQLAFETLTAAMTSDPSYLWTWVCNTACPIKDAGVEHGLANKAAARLLAHLFKVDVTQMPEYQDIIARTSKEPAPVEDMEAGDPDVNTIHVTITGFDSHSGAEALARHIHDSLSTAGQYDTKLKIAATTLVDSARSVALPKKTNTLIYVTGVESRYHTDRVSAVSDPEVPANDDEPVDAEWEIECGGEDPDCFTCEDGGPFDVPSEPKGKMTLNLSLDTSDLSPLHTIDYFRQAYPEADLNVDYKPDLHLCDEIAKQARAAEKKTVHIELDESVEDPEAVVSYIQKTVLDAYPEMAKTEEAPVLANPDYRKNAYVFERMVDGEKSYMVLHVFVDTVDFHPELFVGNGVRIAQVKDVEEMHSLLARSISLEVASYYIELFCNNERWLNRFGDGEEVVLREHEGPFTLFNIAQDSIPKLIYNEVEDCWTAFQNIDRLPALSVILEDPTIIIGAEDYLKVTYGAMMVREHPRLAELFLKYLKYKAQFDPCIGRWIRSYGK